MEEAGVGTGTLFHYFPSKNDLINTIYLDCKDTLIQSMVQNLQEDSPYLEMMESIVFSQIQYFIDHPDKYQDRMAVQTAFEFMWYAIKV